MIDNPSDIIIIDDTIFPLFITEEEEKFDKIRLLLDYLACMNRKCVIKTSQKIWGVFKKQVSENSETYKYLSVLITESKINCYARQTCQQTVEEMVTVYCKEFNQIILISNREYENINTNNGDVILFNIDSFNKYLLSNREFIDYLEELKKQKNN